MSRSDQTPVTGLRAGALFFGVGVAAVAGVWSMGVPGADPVGGALEVLQAGAGNYADWAREGPVDGQPDWSQQFRPVVRGEAANGRLVIAENGCGACHVIPGIVRAHGTVGPSLERFADRAYIAGQMTNRAETLVAYLRAPSDFTPETVMPDTGLTEAEAADAAAYLYTLTDRR
jgi:cytochrome c2